MAKKRPIRVNKLPHPGQKPMWRTPLNKYNELKQSIHFTLTPTVISILDELSISLILPRSVIVEEIFRNPDFISQFKESLIPYSDEIKSMRAAR